MCLKLYKKDVEKKDTIVEKQDYINNNTTLINKNICGQRKNSGNYYTTTATTVLRMNCVTVFIITTLIGNPHDVGRLFLLYTNSYVYIQYYHTYICAT